MCHWTSRGRCTVPSCSHALPSTVPLAQNKLARPISDGARLLRERSRRDGLNPFSTQHRAGLVAMGSDRDRIEIGSACARGQGPFDSVSFLASSTAFSGSSRDVEGRDSQQHKDGSRALTRASLEAPRRALRSSKEMSDLCPVYAPFFGAMVGTQLLCVSKLKQVIGLHLYDHVHL